LWFHETIKRIAAASQFSKKYFIQNRAGIFKYNQTFFALTQTSSLGIPIYVKKLEYLPPKRGNERPCSFTMPPEMIDDIDKRIIQLSQGDLPLDLKPFSLLAQKIGIPEEELLSRVKSLKERGVIRRFGATLRHQEAGFGSNAMAAWRVPEDKIDEVGNAMAGFREVTHCYQRRVEKDWLYNLYTMIHGDTKEDCYQIAKRMSEKTGVKDYVLLFSEKEFKKTSMEYF
jgi:DNA-binding Lrp family transcriptional regulator